MKLKSSIMGLALAGAAALCSSAPAQAQQRPMEPYYFTPKLLYSYTMMDSFDAKGRYGGDFWPHQNQGTGWYKGGDAHDKSFGGGASVGYDFGAYSEYPIRMELEWLYRGNVNSSVPSKMTATQNWNGQFDRWGIPGANSNTGTHDTNSALTSYDVKTTVQTLMINAYLDFPTETPFTPYVGGGLGGAYVDSKVSGVQKLRISGEPGYYLTQDSYTGEKGFNYSYDLRPNGQQNNWNFAWQVSAGCSYQFTDSVAFDLSYRYSDFGSAEFGSKKLLLSGDRSNEDFRPPAPGATEPTPGTNEEGVVIGTVTNKGKYDMSAHEVLFGIRITAF